MLKKAIFFFLFFFLFACAPSLNKDKFIIAGTYLEVQSDDPKAAKIVYQEFKHLNQILNCYDQDSEVYKVNKNPEKEIKISKELIEIIEKAKSYHQFTEKIFDITKGKLYNFWKRWGKNKGKKEFPKNVEIEQLKSFGNINDINIDQTKKTIKLKDTGIVLDLSGIAKGYMVDKAVEKLKEAGVKSALINAGGEIYGLGKNRGKPWQVGIRGPRQTIVKSIEVSNAAVATAGNYEQVYKQDGKIYSHIINPESGYPAAANFLGVTVVAKKCTEADVLATVLFIKGKTFAGKIIKDMPDLKVYFVTENGVERISSYEKK